MPSYDSSRMRLRLADRHIAVLATLLEGETPSEELWPSLVEMQQVGLVGQEGELAPLLAPLLGALADPVLMVQVEVTGEHGTLHHGVIVGQDVAYVHDGWPGQEESEYVPVETNVLVWELSRLVNLHSIDEPESKVERIETTLGVLDAGFQALEESAGGDEASEAAVRSALTGAGLAEPQLTELVALILAMNSMWRITTAWNGEHEGEQAAMVRALAAWDCGPHGSWVREKPAEPVLDGQVGPDSELVLVRTPSRAIWEKITELLPDKADFYVRD
ncbi:hypothetical protein [Streptomyces sp. NPDC047046]|uniref:hypothetical protein n=1 Tax=Streptomyces sp. NPDC047046 TaxID=3155378 RepID=UPI0034010EB5